MAFTSGTPTGTISATDLNNEFGRGYALSSYYGVAKGVPTGGTISYNDLRGKYRYWGGMRFYRGIFTANPGNHGVERRTTGYGFWFTQGSQRTYNPGLWYTSSNGAFRHLNSEVSVESLFWYYYFGWRIAIQTYNHNYSNGRYNQHFYSAEPPYQSGIRIRMMSQAHVNIPWGNFYRQVKGDLPRRYIVNFSWPYPIDLRYIEWQYYTYIG